MIDQLLNMWIRGADGDVFRRCCLPLTVRQANLPKSVRRVILRLLAFPFLASYHRAEKIDVNLSIYPSILNLENMFHGAWLHMIDLNSGELLERRCDGSF